MSRQNWILFFVLLAASLGWGIIYWVFIAK
jgi:hypothetical protein